MDTRTEPALLQRDRCPKCRAQVREMVDANASFVERGAQVVAVLPEPIERARTGHKTVGEAHDLIGRMPEAIILDIRDGRPVPVFAYKGDHPADRPSVDDLLGQVDRVVYNT